MIYNIKIYIRIYNIKLIISEFSDFLLLFLEISNKDVLKSIFEKNS